MTDSRFTTFVGIDVSKGTLDLSLERPAGERSRNAAFHTTNDAAGFARLLRWLSRHAPEREACLLCLEHTGLYMEALLDVLILEGYTCSVVKTSALRRVRPEHHRKDDRFDAGLLASYARRFEDELTPYRAAHPIVEQVRLLHQERRRLVTQRASVKQLLKESPRRRADTAFAEALWREQVALYDRQITALEQELRALIDEDEDLRRRFEQISSVEGIGEQTALMWISLFYGQAHLSARHVASWLGFAPHRERSGTSRRGSGHSTGHGNREARKLLALCAQSAAVHKPRWRAYLGKKVGEGKSYRVVMNNIVNKLIHTACAVWNQDAFYDPNHVSRFVAQAA
jgi:transposase